MGAVVLSAEAAGPLVRELQRALAGHGYPLIVDGRYGDQTSFAVRAFQRDNGLPATSEADAPTWQAVTGRAAPSLLERALELSASFGMHEFGLAYGNRDGAGITWGIAGFTFERGEVQHILSDALATDARLVDEAFGPEASELRFLLGLPLAEQLRWADAHSTGQHKISLVEPWRHAFRAFGEHPDVQALQIQTARERWWNAALADARELGLFSELGVALCFDIHLRRLSASVPGPSAAPFAPERDRRIAVAKASAAAARPAVRNDVRARNLAIARGEGTVHGIHYALRSWGLDESPAHVASVACPRRAWPAAAAGERAHP